MGSRERRRRQKRKRRDRAAAEAGQAHEAAEAATDAAKGNGQSAAAAKGTSRASRSEMKDRAVREQLEPLEEGERPLVVTLGAAFSALCGVFSVVSTVLILVFRVELNGEVPSPVPWIAFTLVFSMMAYGMWRARYWAVLGFQALMLLVILGTSLGLVLSTSAWDFIQQGVVLAIAGTFFFFMVKALARIQMPTPTQRG